MDPDQTVSLGAVWSGFIGIYLTVTVLLIRIVFARILLSRIALKDILETLKICDYGHYLPQ